MSSEPLLASQLEHSLEHTHALFVVFGHLSDPLEELGSKLFFNEFGNGSEVLRVVHVLENGLVHWFLSDSVLPPFVGASAAEGVLAALGESFHTGFQVALMKWLIHILK